MSDKSAQAKYISDSIKNLRTTIGLNQAALATKAGISAAALSKIEQGQRVPTIVVLRKLARALKVEIHEITGEKPVVRSEQEMHDKEFFRKFCVLEELNPEDQNLVLNMAQRLREVTKT